MEILVFLYIHFESLRLSLKKFNIPSRGGFPERKRQSYEARMSFFFFFRCEQQQQLHRQYFMAPSSRGRGWLCYKPPVPPTVARACVRGRAGGEGWGGETTEAKVEAREYNSAWEAEAKGLGSGTSFLCCL